MRISALILVLDAQGLHGKSCWDLQELPMFAQVLRQALLQRLPQKLPSYSPKFQNTFWSNT